MHHSTFTTGLEAAKLAGLSEDRIVIISNGDEPAPEGYQTLDELAEEGSRLYPEPLFNESFLAEGESKTKIAVSNLLEQLSSLLKYLPLTVLQLLLWNHRKIQGRRHLALHGRLHYPDVRHQLPDRQP